MSAQVEKINTELPPPGSAGSISLKENGSIGINGNQDYPMGNRANELKVENEFTLNDDSLLLALDVSPVALKKATPDV